MWFCPTIDKAPSVNVYTSIGQSKVGLKYFLSMLMRAQNDEDDCEDFEELNARPFVPRYKDQHYHYQLGKPQKSDFD